MILVSLLVLEYLDLGMNLLECLLVLWRKDELLDMLELLLINREHDPRGRGGRGDGGGGCSG